jgi:uncharacterized repeat protein (TIGR02543 family)
MAKRLNTGILIFFFILTVALCAYAFLLQAKQPASSLYDEFLISFVSGDGDEFSDVTISGTDKYIITASPEKQGYVFDGWYLNQSFTGDVYRKGDTLRFDEDDSAFLLYAKWLPAQNTPYTVEYYFEKASLTEYEIDADKTVAAQGETQSTVCATADVFDGFVLQNGEDTMSGVIKADGSLVLRLYYAREEYSLDLETNGGVCENGASAAYGAEIRNLPVPQKAGYVFDGWYLEADFANALKDGDVYEWTYARTLYAKWSTADDTPYKVKYYFENLTLDGFDCDESMTEAATGETGSVASAPLKIFKGFDISSELSHSSAVIAPDGSSEISLYYNRQHYYVILHNEKGEHDFFDVFYQSSYSLSVPEAPPYYSFGGWYYNGNEIQASGDAWLYTDKAMTLTAEWNALLEVDGNGYLSLTEHGKALSGVFELPLEFDGREIKGIANEGFADATHIGALVAGKNLTYIGANAFKGCPLLNRLYYKSDSADWQGVEAEDGGYLPKIYFYSQENPREEGNFWHYLYGEIEEWVYKTKLYFVVEGELINEWSVSARPGEVVSVSAGDGTDCGKSGFFVQSWYDGEDMRFLTELPIIMPSEDTYYYGSWQYSLVGEGFMPYVTKFAGKHNSVSYSIDLKSLDEMTALVEYVLFYNLGSSNKIYFSASYLDGVSLEVFQSEMAKAVERHTYANWAVVRNTETQQTVNGAKHYGYFYAVTTYRSTAATKKSTQDNYKQIKSVAYVSDAPQRGDGFNGFAIEKVGKSLSVTSSDQLVYALEHGYRPVPSSADCAAASMYNAAKAVLRRIVNDNMSETEKLLAIYNWLVYSVDYDYAAVRDNDRLLGRTPWQENQAWYLEGVFLNGRAVCDAYAKAAVVLARIEGIVAVRVVSDNHAWNKVYIDADGNGGYEWYCFDSTWGNDSAKRGEVDYEMISYIDFLNTDVYKSGKKQENCNYTDFVSDTDFDVYEFMSFTYRGESYDYVIESREELVILFGYASSLRTAYGDDEYISLSFMFAYSSESLVREINYAKAGTGFTLAGAVIEDVYNGARNVYTLILDF